MHVIIVAHGPVRVTRSSVARIRQSGSARSIDVIPAFDGALGTNPVIAGVSVSAGVGSPAVRSLARSLDSNAPVLVIHDDAAVTSRGIRIFESALCGTADVAVPFSNERDTDQFIGPLPAASEAGNSLNGFSGSVEDGRRISSACFSVFATSAGLLAEFGGSLVIPGATLIRDTIRIELTRAVAAHDLSCNRRLADPGDHTVLVASMIVKDEEEMIEGALESLVGVVDRVEICDTGSSDRTIEIARSMGANVRSIEWRDDFGWARNRALETCRDADFVLQLDADERFRCEEPDAFRRWLHTWRDEVDGVRLTLVNDRGPDVTASRHSAMRIAAAASATFRGALHETFYFENSDAAIMNHVGVGIHHLGYVPEVVSRRNKAVRNIEISRVAFEADSNFKTKIDYARSLLMADEGDAQAERLFHEVYSEIPGNAPRIIVSYVAAMLSRYAVDHGDLARALTLADEALAITANEDVALATVGQILVSQERFDELVRRHRELSTRPPGAPMFVAESNVARYRALVALALIETGAPEDGLALIEQAMSQDAASTVEIAARIVTTWLQTGADPASIVPALAMDPHGVVVGAIAATVAPGLTAQLCAAAVAAGSRERELIKVGLTAALLKQMQDVVDVLMPHVTQLESIDAAGVASIAERRGHSSIADDVRTGMLAAVSL